MGVKLIIFIAIVIVALIVISKNVVIAKKKSRYKLKPILTENEAEFFGRLRTALPESLIFPQVSMSALLEPVGVTGKERFAEQGRINQKRIDFAVYNDQLMLLCIVELDDRTHNRKKDALRDSYFESAGVKTYRWQSKAKPSAEEIHRTIMASADKINASVTPIKTLRVVK